MTTETRYCRWCKEKTPHDHWLKEEGAARVFFAVMTLGLSEAMKTHCFECQKCGKYSSIQT